MLNVAWRMKATSALTNSLIAVLVLLVAGCAGPPPAQSPPPPMASADATPPAPDLAGAPPETQPAPPPPSAQDESTVGMAPIPNPEDLPPNERARIYGHRYDEPRSAAQRATAEPVGPVMGVRRHHAHNTHVWGWRGHAAVAQRHMGRRHGQYAAGGEVHPLRAVRPRAALKPSLGVAPASAAPGIAKPVAPSSLAAAPAAASSAAPPATPKARMALLQTNLAGPVADGAGFVVSDDLAAGKPGVVTLSLPADLYDRVRSEAAKAGLTRDARRFDITAILSGDGYGITPTTAQVVQAPAAGASAVPATTFTWQVQPLAGAGGPVRATVIANLTGAGAAEALPLLSLERPVKPIPTADQQPAETTDPFNLHMGAVDMPGLGKIPVSSILAVILLILVVVILVAAARHTAERDREERRKARAAARAALQAETAATRAEAAAPPHSAPSATTEPPSRSESDRKPEPV